MIRSDTEKDSLIDCDLGPWGNNETMWLVRGVI